MPRDFTDIYRFHSLRRFTFFERLLVRLYGFSLFVFVKLIGSTIRFETVTEDAYSSVKASGKQPILVYWHDRSLPAIYHFRNTRAVVLSSSSFDSEFTARCIQRFGYGIIKGSATRGAVSGLIGMIQVMKQGYTAAFTVDGPKGPRYVAKSGPVLLAKKSGDPLVPFLVECRRYWTIGSWDRLQIPKPFTKAAIIFGEPIYVEARADGEEIESRRSDLQKALDELVKLGVQWRSDH